MAQDVDHDASWLALLSEGLLSGRFRQLEVHSTFTSGAMSVLEATCGVAQVDHDALRLATLNEGLLSAVFVNWQHTTRLRRAHIH